MGYIGTPVQQALTKVTSQSFNGTGSQTVFTLNRAVNTGEELEVFVNNVQQEPGVGKSYTATGTTLTFDAAPSSGTGNIYVVYRGLAEVTRRLEHDPNAALAATTGTFSGDLTVDTNTLYVDSTNNRVGVGTTTPNKTVTVATPQTANTAMEVLRLTGSGAYSSGGSNEAGAGVSFGQYSGTYPDWNLGQISGVRSGASWDGALTFSTNNGTGQSSTTERLRIDSSGNVGIGTSNTTSGKTTINLTGVAVAGDTDGATIGSSGIINLYNSNATTNSTVMLLGGGSDSIVGQIASGIGFTRENSGNWGTQLRFYTHSTATSDLDELKERMRIDSSGDLLVGKTAVGLSTTGFQALATGNQSAFISDGDRALILNRKTSDGSIQEFRKDGTTVGSIGTNENTDLFIAGGDTGLLFNDGVDFISPATATGSGRDNAVDLGYPTVRFKDLYLSGGVYLGGTGAANKLEDYEEGTFTPTFSRHITSPVYSASVASGSYTKIGNVVHIQILIIVNSVTSNGSGNLLISGLPFANGANSYSGVLNVGYNDTFDAAIKDCYVTGSFLQFIPTGITQSNYGGTLSTGYCSVTGTYITN